MSDLPSSSAIFSPSVARQAAHTARDWSYVDDWLASKLAGRTGTIFERNPETLKALLSLATYNEIVDEQSGMLAAAEGLAMAETKASLQNSSRLVTYQTQQNIGLLYENIAQIIEDHLSNDGSVALEVLSSTMVALDLAFVTPEQTAVELIELQAQAYDIQQLHTRFEISQSHVEEETTIMTDRLHRLTTEDDASIAQLAKSNLELQRNIKIDASKLTENDDRTFTKQKDDVMYPTIDDIVNQERAYQEYFIHHQQIDLKLAAFHGLPTDVRTARAELDAKRQELQSVQAERDSLLEALVNRASPRKLG